MKVDLPGLKEKLENFYAYFYHTLQFARQGSKCDKYRMMVMINYSLEGTAYGGDYDGQIGALWITPNRVQDEKLNCIAHELGHRLPVTNHLRRSRRSLGWLRLFRDDFTMDALASKS